MELTSKIKDMANRPDQFPKLRLAYKKVIGLASHGGSTMAGVVKTIVQKMKLSPEEEAGLVWKLCLSKKNPEKNFKFYYESPFKFSSKSQISNLNEGKRMSGFNLSEAKKNFLKGRAQIAELFDRGQLKELAPDVAEEILTAIAVVTAKAYEEQSNQPIEDEKELAQLVMASLKSLYRMRSPILMASRKVVRNPKSSQGKLKRSL
jgi:hypothetical protein